MELKYYAITSQVVFYFYWLATEWLDLFPWNDIKAAKRDLQVKGTIFHTCMMTICIVAFLSGNKWFMGLAVLWFTILLTVEICNWWVPYLFGVHPAEVNRQVYAEHFSRTYRFLPPIKDHNIVDAQHVVVVCLTIVMWFLSVYTLWAKFK